MTANGEYFVYKRKFYIDKIQPFIGKPVIKVITGMRRVGKSCFLRQLLTELESRRVPSRNVLLVDKESLDFDHIRTYADLNDLVAGNFKRVPAKKYLFVKNSRTRRFAPLFAADAAISCQRLGRLGTHSLDENRC